ncbi:alpha/beta hydrolase [Krasilnikovia sp. M28-CT-15]|uniref:alpha/beta hydrolase n=1 Tax=Krasilnikovia sp. M28-CT-15 TaxID=3373540 RepID=UPI0038778E88
MSDEDQHEGSTTSTTFRSLDGLRLAGTFAKPSTHPRSVTVLVHGGGVTRDEGGFFTRLADGMATAGVASLRFDLRGHGESEGRQEDLTIAGVLNDIRSAVAHARTQAGTTVVNLLGASFGGGICGYYAGHRPTDLDRLVLINPLVNYKGRFVDDKPYWSDDQIDESAGRELSENGFLPHSPTFKLGRPLLNEVFHLRPDQAVERIAVPTLILHGTADTFIPVQSSRDLAARVPAPVKLIEFEGAQHGIAVHDDPRYLDPRTQEWQSAAIQSIAEWLV